MERNVNMRIVNPMLPKILENEQINVYVPVASSEGSGVASFNDEQFVVDTDGTVELHPKILEILEDVASGGSNPLYPVYEGEYVIEPSAVEDKVLETKNTLLTKNVTVKAVPLEKVSNVRGGTTAIIA